MSSASTEGESAIHTEHEPGSAQPARRGPLMIIGGAEDKLHKRTVLSEFVRAAGGDQARIVVIPTASSLGHEVVEVYDALFRKLGAAEVVSAGPQNRDDAHDPSYVELIEKATGIFMTGGNQLKLSGVVTGTPFGEAIRAAHRRGVVVGGTSAGASIQSSHMVAFGVGGATPKQRMTQVAAGLGLLDSSVIDQHFDQRNRYGRLLMIVAQSPQLLGMGVDEDTAAVITFDDDQQTLSVIGRGAVTIFDPSRIITNAHDAPRSRAILASNVILHVLPAGQQFDLVARRLILQPPGVDEAGAAEMAEMAEASHDLRRMALDIAAADASPSTLRRRIAAASRRRTATNDQKGTSE